MAQIDNSLHGDLHPSLPSPQNPHFCYFISGSLRRPLPISSSPSSISSLPAPSQLSSMQHRKPTSSRGQSQAAHTKRVLGESTGGGTSGRPRERERERGLPVAAGRRRVIASFSSRASCSQLILQARRLHQSGENPLADSIMQEV